jgi:RimJ/RimL family protein N-acetyltransferase
MRLEARLVENELFKGEWSTELDFAMLADEWPGHRDRFAGAQERSNSSS